MIQRRTISLQSDGSGWRIRPDNATDDAAGYELLLEMNSGYENVIRGLAALPRHAAFDREELSRFRALAQEARSSANSCLTGVLETAFVMV